MSAQILPSIHPSAVIESSGILVIPESTHIEAHATISVGKAASLQLGERNTLYPSVVIRLSQGQIVAGNDVSYGPGVVLYETRSGLRIGDNCMLAAGVKICGSEHGHEFTDRPMREQAVVSKEIIIEDDVWIGMNAVIHPGVTIGTGTIIGSGSVVTRSIPAFCVAYGSPCRFQRSRLTNDSDSSSRHVQ